MSACLCEECGSMGDQRADSNIAQNGFFPISKSVLHMISFLNELYTYTAMHLWLLRVPHCCVQAPLVWAETSDCGEQASLQWLLLLRRTKCLDFGRLQHGGLPCSMGNNHWARIVLYGFITRKFVAFRWIEEEVHDSAMPWKFLCHNKRCCSTISVSSSSLGEITSLSVFSISHSHSVGSRPRSAFLWRTRWRNWACGQRRNWTWRKFSSLESRTGPAASFLQPGNQVLTLARSVSVWPHRAPPSVEFFRQIAGGFHFLLPRSSRPRDGTPVSIVDGALEPAEKADCARNKECFCYFRVLFAY